MNFQLNNTQSRLPSVSTTAGNFFRQNHLFSPSSPRLCPNL
ncbi:hypothetical protein FDUTEX481_06620 [Tolypothrix sp. PCC 7601]|nr:hypothetical protein FDUTEX481_06620 [Tolypothrix sp. PCC 7601]